MITIKYLAPTNISSIGIVGTGIQARLQVEYLHTVTPCKKILVWGRNPERAADLKYQYRDSTYDIQIVDSIDELAEQCNVIITTTPSTQPLLQSHQIRPGTHITAIGSDTSEKRELDTAIINKADVVVSDSIPQSRSRGEVYQARLHGNLDESKLIELGNLIQNPALGRKSNEQITIADLTGVAVQDIMIATAVYNSYKKSIT